ncbi:tryptophan synthase subunit alpha [Raineyella sp. LH-20]|uniref:tryptophan synthase subunit alpha n=1 Tax=Raineyella sp. LH-20 TaxID=3081204 RepID=UPI002954ACA0|nr:tryptophan synthase subunit alpha [Raineyella sp. LH-20]WOP17960.1 tryptophan synthase subunit alpha [Raineyella sp. LH-20]
MTAPGNCTPAFDRAAAERRAVFIGYLPVGYPTVPGSLDAMRALVDPGDGPGADIVEIGIPYSDPMMDGVTIQRAATRALERGVRVRDVLAATEAVAAAGAIPCVMSYWNLIEQYGCDAFARDFRNAGGAGVITPDLTPDESDDWIPATDAHGVDRIYLVAPSSTDERIRLTADAARGWLYATAVMGVTGARDTTSDAGRVLTERVRALSPDTRVGIGLGVSNGAQAAEIGAYADAVIVGSALVRTLLDADDAGRPDDLTALRALTADLAGGVRTAR